jgi:hypothetical protein
MDEKTFAMTMYSSDSGFGFLIKPIPEVAVLFFSFSNMARGNFENSEIGKDRMFELLPQATSLQ